MLTVVGGAMQLRVVKKGVSANLTDLEYHFKHPFLGNFKLDQLDQPLILTMQRSH